MNNNEPYLTLIENSISKYNEKYGKNLRYEITNFPYNYQFVIYDDITPILFKSIHKDSITEMSDVYQEIISDLFIGSIERVFMQFHNQKKVVPKPHAKIEEGKINITKSNW